MNSKIIEKEHIVSKNYPHLGIFKDSSDSEDGLVVMFISEDTGVVVKEPLDAGSSRRLGEFADDWDENCFTDFDGEVILSN